MDYKQLYDELSVKYSKLEDENKKLKTDFKNAISFLEDNDFKKCECGSWMLLTDDSVCSTCGDDFCDNCLSTCVSCKISINCNHCISNDDKCHNCNKMLDIKTLANDNLAKCIELPEVKNIPKI